jgi:hypothetical protein
MEALTKGTVEPLMVALRDRLNNIATLDSVDGKLFDVKKKSDDSSVTSNQVWFIDTDYPMYAICMIDTTLAGFTPGDEYKLYVKWNSGAEQVIKGPLFFRVESD